MYQANLAKLQQCKEHGDELCDSKGWITHMGSGKFWDKWNPILLALIREELRGPAGDAVLVAKLREKIPALGQLDADADADSNTTQKAVNDSGVEGGSEPNANNTNGEEVE